MKTIGARNRSIVRNLVKAAVRSGLTSKGILTYVFTNLPSSVFSTWNGAWSEVKSIVSEEVVLLGSK